MFFTEKQSEERNIAPNLDAANHLQGRVGQLKRDSTLRPREGLAGPLIHLTPLPRHGVDSLPFFKLKALGMTLITGCWEVPKRSCAKNPAGAWQSKCPRNSACCFQPSDEAPGSEGDPVGS